LRPLNLEIGANFTNDEEEQKTLIDQEMRCQAARCTTTKTSPGLSKNKPPALW